MPCCRRYISAFSETLALTVIQVRTRGYSQGVLTGYPAAGEGRGTARRRARARGVLTGYSRGPVWQAKGVAPLVDALVREPEDHIKSASAWSLGQIGRCVSTHEYPCLRTPKYPCVSTQEYPGWCRHSPDHAKALAVQNVFTKLLAVSGRKQTNRDSLAGGARIL